MNRRWARALTLLCALAAATFAMRAKGGWHIDEIATLGLANGSQNGYITACDDEKYGRGAFIADTILGDSLAEAVANLRSLAGEVLEKGLSGVSIRDKYLAYREGGSPIWKTGEEFLAFLSAEEGFSLRDVYVNQILDTHPPLYYVFVRAAYSLYALFAGEAFSLWPAFCVNALFLAGVCLMLMRIGERRFGSLSLGAGAALLFALSPAGIGTAVYMRMYMALAFFALWSLDAHMEWAAADWRLSRSLSWRLIAATALGFLTHYYFAIYAVCMAIVCGVGMARAGRARAYWGYIGRMAGAAGLSLLVWPFSLAHLLLSNRSAQAVGSLSEGGWLSRVGSYAALFSGYLFGAGPWIPLLLTAALAAGIALSRRAGKRAEGLGGFALALAPAAGYFLIVALIAPYQDLRYVACVAPALLLAALFCARTLLNAARVRGKSRGALLIATAALIAAAGLFGAEPPFLYRGEAGTRDFARANAGLPCVYVTSTGAAFYREMPDFQYYDRVLIVTEEQLPLLSADETLSGADELIVYIHDSYDQPTLMRKLLENTRYTAFEALSEPSEASDARAYRLRA